MKEVQMQLEELVIQPEFKEGDTVYLIHVIKSEAYLAKGRVIIAHKVDNLTTKYLVQGRTFSTWAYDQQVYSSADELLKDFGMNIRD